MFHLYFYTILLHKLTSQITTGDRIVAFGNLSCVSFTWLALGDRSLIDFYMSHKIISATVDINVLVSSKYSALSTRVRQVPYNVRGSVHYTCTYY